MKIKLFGYSISLHVLILIGIFYLIMVVNALSSSCNREGRKGRKKKKKKDSSADTQAADDEEVAAANNTDPGLGDQTMETIQGELTNLQLSCPGLDQKIAKLNELTDQLKKIQNTFDSTQVII